MSMRFPKYVQKNIQERTGVSAVAGALARLKLIWRETSNADVGIDGQIEYVTPDGSATGQMVAVQIKSGPSFLIEQGSSWIFYPDEKHRFYWERFPLPVLVILHDPETDLSYWQDVRRALRTPTQNGSGILIPKKNILQNSSPEEIFENFAVSGHPFLELPDVLSLLIQSKSNSASFPVTYFDLFCNGLTNICRSLYFGMDVAMIIAEEKLAISESPVGVGLGEAEYAFLFEFIQFLVHQHLADIDYSDCLIDWYDRELVPSFIAPLTSRGRTLVRIIGELQESLEKDKIIPITGLRAAQEDFVQMVFSQSHYRRLPLIEAVTLGWKQKNS